MIISICLYKFFGLQDDVELVVSRIFFRLALYWIFNNERL